MTPRTRLLLDVALAYLLFWAAHTVYRGSTGVVQQCDSAYSLAVAERLLGAGTIEMRDCIPADPEARRAMPGYRDGHDMPYQFIRHPNPNDLSGSQKVYYGYPLGSTVLSLPWVRHYVRDRGFTMFLPSGVPNYAVENEVQVRVASRVAALTVVLLYGVCRFFCPPAAALPIAAGYAFASPVWSTLARGLWSHTWTVFMLTAAVTSLLVRRRLISPTWRSDLGLGFALGTAVFWMGFCRQHAVVSAAAIGAYLLLHHRRMLAFAVLGGGAWAAGLVAVSLHVFGTPLPPSVYDPNNMDGKDVLARFAALMASPSRGLLVFCPYLVVVGWMLVAFRRNLPDPALLLPAGLAVAGQTAMFSAYNGWHAGHSYGPRYFCDVLPWFVLATAVAVRGLLDAPGMRRRKVLAAVALAACVGWGGFVHARGANSVTAWRWNDRVNAVPDEAAMTDWRHPQFLAGITFEVLPDGSIRYLK
jgi:hypothetical protein